MAFLLTGISGKPRSPPKFLLSLPTEPFLVSSASTELFPFSGSGLLGLGTGSLSTLLISKCDAILLQWARSLQLGLP